MNLPMYAPTGNYIEVGQAPAPLIIPAWAKAVSLASGAAMAYHGYKRTGSAGWAFGWSVFGSFMPFFAVPLSLAQGYSKKKK